MKLGDRQDIPREIPILNNTVQRALVMALFSDPLLRETICRTCLSCFNWAHEEETCKLYKQRPPAKIIANGCESYDDLPF